MNDEASLLHPIRCRLENPPVNVDLDQVRCTNLVQHQAEWIDQEMIPIARNPRGDMGIDDFGPAEVRGQPIAGGEVNADPPLLGRIPDLCCLGARGLHHLSTLLIFTNWSHGRLRKANEL